MASFTSFKEKDAILFSIQQPVTSIQQQAPPTQTTPQSPLL